MKFFVFIIVFFAFFLFTVTSLKAQESSSILVVVTYNTREDIDYLFANTSRVLEYLEGEDVETPIFLAIVSDSQLKTIQEKGYEVVVIDRNADVNSYVFLYHPVENQSILLADEYNAVIPVSGHYTLVKLSPGQEFSHDGAGAAFFDIPFSEVIVTPAFRTREADVPTVTPTPALTSEVTDKSSGSLLYIIVVLIVSAVVFVVLFVIIKRIKKKRIEQNNLPPPINTV